MELTLQNYKKVIEFAKIKFRFIKFGDSKFDHHVALLRHDVDFSPESALRMAEIENEIGVESTYFIQISSRFYNFNEPQVLRIFKKISKFNHDIGVHFDSSVLFDVTANKIEEKLELEKKILENAIEKKVKLFTLHNPTTIKNKHLFESDYAGMHNASYDKALEDFKFCSDSNGVWKSNSIDQVFKDTENNKVYFLSHPLWWQNEVLSPRLKIQKCVADRCKYVLSHYDDLLKTNNRLNII